MPTTSVPILSASVGQPTTLNLDISHRLTIERHIVNLFKECLMIVEQLGEEHDEAMGKLFDALPENYREYVRLADHFSEEKADRIIREYEATTTVPAEFFDEVLAALDAPASPNAALTRAAKRARTMVSRD